MRITSWKPYISPLYSPCIATKCAGRLGLELDPVGELADPGDPDHLGPDGLPVHLLLLPKAYYRAFWQAPASCAVREPHAKYTGETRFPLILQNAHRYFFYVALLFNFILTWDAIEAFRNHSGQWGHMGLGTLVLIVNAVAAVAVLAVLPRLPAHHRRAAQALLQAPGQVLDVDAGLQAQRQAHAAGLGVAVLGAVHRPVHPAGGIAACSATRGSSKEV